MKKSRDETGSSVRCDRIFDDEMQSVGDFRFDAKVASVFDDMVDRSVPFYAEIQRMVAEMAADFAIPGSAVYDLGCATGTTLLAMDATVGDEVEFVGIDDSKDMLTKCGKRSKMC